MGATEDEFNLRLGRTLDIAGVGELHAELCSAMGKDAPITLDASETSRIDAAALQLLVALFISADIRHKQIGWKSPSEALVRAADMLGLTRQLKLSEVVPSGTGVLS